MLGLQKQCHALLGRDAVSVCPGGHQHWGAVTTNKEQPPSGAALGKDSTNFSGSPGPQMGTKFLNCAAHSTETEVGNPRLRGQPQTASHWKACVQVAHQTRNMAGEVLIG